MYVFGKNPATRAHAETFADIGSNVPGPNVGVSTKDGLETEFPAMCSSRMNLLSDDMMIGRSDRSSDCRLGFSGQKRKCDMQTLKTYDHIWDAMDTANDQLRAIAERPNRGSQKEDTMMQEVMMHM